MKKITFLFAATALFVSSCSKKDAHRNTGQVTGYSTTTDPCSGGFTIKITDDDKKGVLVTKTLPADAGINQFSTFPINVEVDYTQDDKTCDQLVIVTRVRKL